MEQINKKINFMSIYLIYSSLRTAPKIYYYNVNKYNIQLNIIRARHICYFNYKSISVLNFAEIKHKFCNFLVMSAKIMDDISSHVVG